MILNKLKKQGALVFPYKEMRDLPKVSENCDHDLSKVSKVTVTDNFDLSKVTNLLDLTSNLLDFYVNPEA